MTDIASSGSFADPICCESYHKHRRRKADIGRQAKPGALLYGLVIDSDRMIADSRSATSFRPKRRPFLIAIYQHALKD